ncbi:MAG: TonB-dependent hemoglobin/transferrin/lactoferrin family receptor [Rubrivivax sp.]|nr:TonB-dependent hemoglobin/transferrin/lactoferrin family receptor [Rubrivivax sp.]
MLRKTPFALALVVAWGLGPTRTLAQSSTPTDAIAATPLPAVTNTATRTDRRVDEVPATVTVVPAADIEAAGARDIKDLFRNQVDLTVRHAPGRFGLAGASTGRAGNEGINIRGLEGNQVLMLVDGIRVPGSFSFGAFATGRADYLALEATQAAEVLRGPASTSFGSDGLAGALSLRTLDPDDVLKRGQTLGGFVRLAGTQVDDSVALTAAAAVRQGSWQALLLLSQRQGHETRSQGTHEALNSSRTAPNPLDYRQQVLLGKVFFSPVPAHRFGATVEAMQRRAETDVFSARALPPAPPAVLPATAVIDLDASDRVHRARVSAEHRYDDLNGLWFQKAESRAYVQDADTRQFAMEDRNTAADRTRTSRYREKVVGLSTQFETSLSGTLPQRLSYGIDASRTRITSVRDGTPNPSAPPPFGETFPAKPFPDTDYTLAGAYLQSEIELGGLAGLPGRLTLIPGLRYDRFMLDPSAEGYGGGAIVSLSDSAVTPRLGAVWRLADAFAPYAQWSRGFRAPTPGQVNNGFTNVASGYRSVGNPNLQPETAQSLEVGLRGKAGGWHWQVAAYDNRYRDFISQEAVSGAGTPADPTLFQFINLAQARIRGVELRGEWRLSPAWSLNAATALTRGTSTRNGVAEPLDSVEPARTALGLRYRAGAWDLRADVLHAQAKTRDRIRAATPAAFAPVGYTVLDFSARWQASPRWTLIANLNNVTDATYWRWSDVRGVPDTSTVKDAFTAPGRHLQLTLRHDF